MARTSHDRNPYRSPQAEFSEGSPPALPWRRFVPFFAIAPWAILAAMLVFRLHPVSERGDMLLIAAATVAIVGIYITAALRDWRFLIIGVTYLLLHRMVLAAFF